MTGKVHKYGDHIDTDVIIPARYLNSSDPAELARHCMEDIDPEFTSRVRPGDILVGGRNFGCGSSREHAPMVIRECGVACVIAESFARIFFRNAINIGLPVLECPEAARGARPGDELEVDLDGGAILNRTQNLRYAAAPFPPFMRELMESGGLTNYIRNRRASS